MKTMNIAIFGATGSIGTHLVQQSLDEGHRVTAFARNPSKLDLDHPNLTLVSGDVLEDQERIESAVAGQDAVVVVLGAGAKGRVRSEGTRNIIAAMQRAGVRRLICQSTLGAGDSSKNLNLKWRLLFGTLLRGAMADHQLQEKHVRESGLDWTITRPAAFTDGERSGSYQHGFGARAKGLTLKISRADVADFLLRQLGSDRYLHMSPAVSC